MPKYVIEREIPGAGKLSSAALQAISQKSCSVLSELGPSVQWLESFVTGDKVYCVYIAPNRGHGARARQAWRLPREPRLRGHPHDRPDDRRVSERPVF